MVLTETATGRTGRILWVVAYPAEARPIIARYGLVRMGSCGRFALYGADGHLLIVCGLGRVCSAVATTVVCLQEPLRPRDVVVNLGICGCADPTIERGDMLAVHSILEKATRQWFYPDMLGAHGLREAPLMTVDEPLSAPAWSRDDPCLVDMEGSAFWFAAARFAAPHRIAVFKVVADYLDPSTPAPEQVETWVGSGLGAIERWAMNASEASPPGVLDEWKLEPGFVQLMESWKLTETQRHQLTNLLRACGARGKRVTVEICKQTKRPTTKAERNHAFNMLCDEIKAKL